jgi:hypothetical protein
VPEKHECIASRALENAIMTHPEAIPASTREKLAPIIGKYFGES